MHERLGGLACGPTSGWADGQMGERAGRRRADKAVYASGRISGQTSRLFDVQAIAQMGCWTRDCGLAVGWTDGLVSWLADKEYWQTNGRVGGREDWRPR